MRHSVLAVLGLALITACAPGAKDSTKSGGNGGDDSSAGPPDTTAPTVTLTSPLDGATLTGTASLAAAASDDVGVAAVSFGIDGIQLDSDDSDPYEATWDTTTMLNGNYVLSATATDAAGNAASVSANVLVQNDSGASASSISIINPVNNATVCGTVNVEAAVSLAGATVVFTLDGNDLATDSSEPYSWSWNTTGTTNGDHIVRPTATGSDGRAAQSTIIVDVENSGSTCDNLPSVSFTAPDPGSYRYGTLDLAADASDDVGVLKVQFFVDNGLLTEDSSIPYGTTWDSTAFDEGPHTLKAIAYDTSSQTAETEITVTVDRTAPVVSITAPTDGDTVEGTIDLAADVTENLALEQAEFFVDGSSVGVVTAAPYTLTWDTTSATYGRHAIRVVATDMAGLTGTDDVTVTVDNPPAIHITSPTDGSTVKGDVSVAASGSDDGGINSVRLLVDGASQGTDSSSPYAWTWDSCAVAKGAHTLEVDATDGPHVVTDSIAVSSDQKLQVELASPSGALSASETLTAYTSDDDNISKVVFDLDGTVIDTETTTSGSGAACTLTCTCDAYAGAWDVTSVSVGSHTLTVTATNSVGDTATDSATVTVTHDSDGDGYDAEEWGGTDCDDARSAVHPGATENCSTSYDDNCAGSTNEQDATSCTTYYADADGDGYGSETDSECWCSASGVYDTRTATDCDDTDSSIHPSATEVVADGVDQNCDGYDACYKDGDGDGYGGPSTTTGPLADCSSSKTSAVSTDCNDSSATIYPGAPEVTADGIDQDCDGVDNCYEDDDGDNYGTSTVVVGSSLSCATGTGAANATDCDDTSSTIHPGATEIVADGIDQDCDGYDACYKDADGDGYGGTSTTTGPLADCASSKTSAVSTDCNDSSATIHPGATEITADGIDQDCDGVDNCYEDDDGDNYGTSTVVVGSSLNCATGTGAANPKCARTGSEPAPGRPSRPPGVSKRPSEPRDAVARASLVLTAAQVGTFFRCRGVVVPPGLRFRG